MKVSVVGGGGFRAPLAWESIASVALDTPVDEVVLQDVSATRLARTTAVIEGLRRERGSGPPVHATTELEAAVDGAAFIFCALRVGGLEARIVDETVPLREGVLGQETVGPGGICFALRTVPAMLSVARVVRERAPSAWFLNFTNPAGLVTEAIRAVLGERAVGICDSPTALCARVAAALRRPMSALVFDYAGVNHLGWLLGVGDDGVDLLPSLLHDDARLERVDEARLFGLDRVRELGMVPNEYVFYVEAPNVVVDGFRRAGATRAQLLAEQQAAFYGARDLQPSDALAAWRRARDARFGTYMDEAWSGVSSPKRSRRAPAHPGPREIDGHPGEAGYAAIAAAFLRAVAHDSGDTLILNVTNDGSLAGLDHDAVVEVPCTVTSAGPRPRRAGKLPPAQADLVAGIKEVERTTIRAAVEGSRDLALRALAAHPVVRSDAAAARILSGYLAALPQLAERLR